MKHMAIIEPADFLLQWLLDLKNTTWRNGVHCKWRVPLGMVRIQRMAQCMAVGSEIGEWLWQKVGWYLIWTFRQHLLQADIEWIHVPRFQAAGVAIMPCKWPVPICGHHWKIPNAPFSWWLLLACWCWYNLLSQVHATISAYQLIATGNTPGAKHN